MICTKTKILSKTRLLVDVHHLKYDGVGVPVIKASGDRLLYQDKSLSLDKIVDQKKVNFDFVAWFNG